MKITVAQRYDGESVAFGEWHPYPSSVPGSISCHAWSGQTTIVEMRVKPVIVERDGQIVVEYSYGADFLSTNSGGGGHMIDSDGISDTLQGAKEAIQARALAGQPKSNVVKMPAK